MIIYFAKKNFIVEFDNKRTKVELALVFVFVVLIVALAFLSEFKAFKVIIYRYNPFCWDCIVLLL